MYSSLDDNLLPLDFATKHIALIISISYLKIFDIFSNILSSSSKPFVSPNPGVSTIFRGGRFLFFGGNKL